MKVKRLLVLGVSILLVLVLGQVSLATSPAEPKLCITVEKSGPATAKVGEPITYHFVITNCSDVDFYKVELQDVLGGGITWTGGSLASGQQVVADWQYTPSECGTLKNGAQAYGYASVDWETDGLWAKDYSNQVSTDIPCEPSVGTGTPGYWKNHPDAWPVEEITIGGETSYTRDEAIDLMQRPVKGDKTYTMFKALVAAKLNVLIGNESGCVDSVISDADAWMAENPVGSGVKAGGKKSPWRVGEPLYETLDAYNNGELCAPHRD